MVLPDCSHLSHYLGENRNGELRVPEVLLCHGCTHPGAQTSWDLLGEAGLPLHRLWLSLHVLRGREVQGDLRGEDPVSACPPLGTGGEATSEVPVECHTRLMMVMASWWTWPGKVAAPHTCEFLCNLIPVFVMAWRFALAAS